MKQVYLLIECSGEYEDYIEYPLKAFTSFEKANKAKEDYERKNQMAAKQARLCYSCPLSLNIYDSEEKFLKDKALCRCSSASSAYFVPEEGVVCPDEAWSYESCYYKITPVELEED